MVKQTSFGSMQTLVEKHGLVVAELLRFEREGRGHVHDKWEICHVLEGKGVVYVGEQTVHVQEGDVCKIPPNTLHWMNPTPYMEMLLVYANTD